MSYMPQAGSDIRQPLPQVSNRIGKAGLILAICGLLFFWVPMVYPAVGIIATVFCAIGYANVRAGKATNKKTAVMGLVLGILSVVVPIALVLGFAVYVTVMTGNL